MARYQRPDSGAKLVDVVQFVDAAEVDAIFYKQTYYLAPEKTGIKAYKLMVDALSESDKIALAKVSIREKQHMAALRVADGVMVMETMFWPDEIREPAFEELETKVEIRPEEVAMARSLIDNLTRAFDESEWVDTTREAVEALAAKKVAGEEIVAPEAPEPTKVIDLLEALKASVEATKSNRVAS